MLSFFKAILVFGALGMKWLMAGSKVISGIKSLRMAFAALRFLLFLLWAGLQIPFLLFIATFWRRFGIWQMRIFMRGWAILFGMRFRVHGALDTHRPLMVVANHISLFEVVLFPAMFGTAFFVKGEVKSWPILGWFVKNFGNAFIDRRASKAAEALETIKRQMKTAKNPFVIFPEGTTSNGDYVLPFKSAPFEFLGDVPDAKIQPVAIIYRDKYGNKLSPQVLADEYAYFDNKKQTQPPYATKELGIGALLWRNLMRGGFLVEAYVMPVYSANGKDRKTIATDLHKIVEKKFLECK